jgi:hypothetical protein
LWFNYLCFTTKDTKDITKFHKGLFQQPIGKGFVLQLSEPKPIAELNQKDVMGLIISGIKKIAKIVHKV